jgi:hypothetical protein
MNRFQPTRIGLLLAALQTASLAQKQPIDFSLPQATSAPLPERNGLEPSQTSQISLAPGEEMEANSPIAAKL